MSKTTYTLLGAFAILIWGTSPAYTKILADDMGAFYASAVVNLIGGVMIVAKQRFVDGKVARFSDASGRYWLVCGGLFVLYQAMSYLSMEVIVNNEVVVTAILIRFLWPLAALLLTIPILNKKASVFIVPCAAISLLGVVLSQLHGDLHVIGNLLTLIKNNSWAYILSFALALSWGLYTNFAKKFMPVPTADGLGIFMLETAGVLFLLAWITGEHFVVHQHIILPLLYQGVVVGCIGNVCWNVAILKGDTMAAVLFSNFLPPISAVSSALTLHLPIPLTTVVGSLLVVLGTYLSKRCFMEDKKIKSQQAVS